MLWTKFAQDSYVAAVTGSQTFNIIVANPTPNELHHYTTQQPQTTQ